jgi:predicted permease
MPFLTAAYRALVTLCYPSAHRQRVGPDMIECFEDLVADAHRRRGWMGAAAVALRTLAEVPLSALGAHREEIKKKRTGGGGSMDTLIQDVRFAARGLVRSPGFTLLAVMSLGLGVGANTAMFSMINSSLWADLPVPDAEKLVRVNDVRERAMQVSFANYVDIADGADVLEGAFMHRLETFALVSDELSQVVHGELVTANYFDVLGIDPRLGRFLDARQHGVAEAEPVAVISHYLWTNTFGQDPAVVGRAIELNDHRVTVIGVAPEPFHGTKFGLAMDLWVPVRPWSLVDGWIEGWDRARGNRSMMMVARLASGATIETANAALETVATRLASEYPEYNTGMRLRATPDVAGQIAPDQAAIPNLVGLLAVLGSGLVLLVACGNVASLLLARAVARRPEMGVRVALGAGRGRILRQLLTESVILALLGAVAGTGIAAWVSRLDARLFPNIPYRFAIDTSPNTEALLFALVASLLAVLVFGLAPGLQASDPAMAGALRGDNRTAGWEVSGSGLLNAVVVGVVSVSFVALFLAGLFVASLGHVRTIDPGLASSGRVMATMDLGLAGYRSSEVTPLLDEVLERVGALPGVRDVAVASSIPLGDFRSSSVVFADDLEYALDEPGLRAWRSQLTPEWFRTAELRLLAGRTFDARDDAHAPTVAVINEVLARTLWPDEDPIGKRIRYGREAGSPSTEVVGVVATGKYNSMIEPPTPALYEPLRQLPRTRWILMASTDGDPSLLISPLRDAVRALDPSLALYDAKTSAEHMRNAFWLFRVGAEVAVAIGLLAAAMAAAGLYGIMTFRVGRRRREMGIRVALGAGRGTVLRHVLADTLRLVGLGVGLGGALALAASGAVDSIVVGVEPTSARHLALVAAGLTLLAVAATLAPALAATRADPVEAIKTE